MPRLNIPGAMHAALAKRPFLRNVLWNLFGSGAPMLVAVLVIPIMIRELGIERFGILTIAWTVVGYLGLLDLGLGEALTKLMVDDAAANESRQMPDLFWTGFHFLLAFGLIGGGGLALVSPWLVNNGFKISPELRRESLGAFYLLGLSVPFTITQTGFRGALEALRRFDLINSASVPFSVLSLLAPLFVLPFSRNLTVLVAVLVTVDLLRWLCYLLICLRAMPKLGDRFWPRRSLSKPLLSFGGWVSVTNVVGPVMTFCDRFLIGGLVSMTAVAYYTTPYEVVIRLTIIPGAVINVLFPAFTEGFALDPDRVGPLMHRWIKYIFLTTFPVALVVVSLAHAGLAIWLGNAFADHSTPILQWLAVGVLVNGLARVPFALIRAAHRPDLTAKLHLVELPLYVLALWWLLSTLGVIGAAIAWTVRVVADAVALFVIAHAIQPSARSALRSFIGMLVAAGLLLAFAALLPSSAALKTIIVVAALSALTLVGWTMVLPERTQAS